MKTSPDWDAFVARNAVEKARATMDPMDVLAAHNANQRAARTERAQAEEAAKPDVVTCDGCDFKIEFDENVVGSFADAWAYMGVHQESEHPLG